MYAHRSCSLALLLLALANHAHAQQSVPAIPPPSVAQAAPPAPALQLRAQDYGPAEPEMQPLPARRPSLFGPILTTAVGGAVAYGALAWAESIEARRFLHGRDSVDTGPLRPLYITAGLSAVVAGAGLAWLIYTLRQRRQTHRPMGELQQSSRSVLVNW